MKHFATALFVLFLSIPQFATAADEVKTAPAEAAKQVEKPEPVKEIKIGSVDPQILGEKSEAGIKAMTTLKEMYEKIQSNIKKKEKELEKLKAALQSSDLTADKRAAKEKQFQKKFGEYQKYGQSAQQDFAKKQVELSTKVKEDLDKIVSDYSREHGYAVVFNKQGLIYNDNKVKIEDLTDEILKIANSTGKK